MCLHIRANTVLQQIIKKRSSDCDDLTLVEHIVTALKSQDGTTESRFIDLYQGGAHSITKSQSKVALEDTTKRVSSITVRIYVNNCTETFYITDLPLQGDTLATQDMGHARHTSKGSRQTDSLKCVSANAHPN